MFNKKLEAEEEDNNDISDYSPVDFVPNLYK